MKIKSEKIKMLANCLHVQTSNDRIVVYNGVAEAVVRKLMVSHNFGKRNYEVYMRKNIKDIVYRINELAIVDRSMLENIIVNNLKYRLSLRELSYSDLPKGTSFIGIMGIYNYFSKDNIELIDNNFTSYKNAMNAADTAIPYLFDNTITED